MGAGPLNPIIGAVEFERIPQNMRGRVFGAVTAGAWIAMPLGMLLGGVFTERLWLDSHVDRADHCLFHHHPEHGFYPCHERNEQKRNIPTT